MQLPSLQPLPLPRHCLLRQPATPVPAAASSTARQGPCRIIYIHTYICMCVRHLQERVRDAVRHVEHVHREDRAQVAHVPHDARPAHMYTYISARIYYVPSTRRPTCTHTHTHIYIYIYAPGTAAASGAGALMRNPAAAGWRARAQSAALPLAGTRGTRGATTRGTLDARGSQEGAACAGHP